MNRKNIPELALKAMKKAMCEMIEEHKLNNRPLAVWRNNRVMWISPYNINEEWKNERKNLHT
jgi:hypothetical protein